MNKQKTSDYDIQLVVGFYQSPLQEVELIKRTQAWSEEDFLSAIKHLDVDLPHLTQETRDQLREVYRSLRIERQATDARINSEEVNASRHDEIVRQLEKLKKPHWSIVPIFWLTVGILIVGIVSYLALRR
jgi:hypothetical protein